MIERFHNLLKTSSCFGDDVCITLPCACAATLANAGWMPIGSAPQDGKTRVILGAWDKDASRSTVTVLALERFDSEQGDTTKPRAIFGMGAIFYPTHWMPLPPPPIAPTAL